jgi:hypothetical protein
MFHRTEVIVVALVVTLLLGFATAIAVTLVHTSDSTTDMYRACLAGGNSPRDCRDSINGWAS